MNLPDPRWEDWLDSQPDPVPATHRTLIKVEWTVDVAVPPYQDSDEALVEVLAALPSNDDIAVAINDSWGDDLTKPLLTRVERQSATGIIGPLVADGQLTLGVDQ